MSEAAIVKSPQHYVRSGLLERDIRRAKVRPQRAGEDDLARLVEWLERPPWTDDIVANLHASALSSGSLHFPGPIVHHGSGVHSESMTLDLVKPLVAGFDLFHGPARDLGCGLDRGLQGPGGSIP